MTHYATRRRTLAGPDVNLPPPPTSSTTAPAKNSHPTIKTLDPTIPPFDAAKPHHISNHFSRLNLLKHCKFQKPTPKDIHMQAKSLTSSDDSGSIIRPKFQLPHRTTNATRGEKLPKNDICLEKRCPKDLENEKQEKQTVGVKMKEIFPVTTKETKGKDLEASRDSVQLVGRRRPLGRSRVELSDILANCGVRVVSVDMPPFMQIHAVDFARKIHDSLEKFSSKALALSMKKEFDGVYGPAWHCIVGTSFGSFVTHSVGGFLYFSMDQKLYILLFKTTVQRAD